MNYIESPDGGTRHAYFGGDIPKGWHVVEGAIPGPGPQADPLKPMQDRIAALENDVAAIKGRAP